MAIQEARALNGVYIRLMLKEDVSHLGEIARESFPDDLPPPSFKRAFQDRFRQWFFVACEEKSGVEIPAGARSQEPREEAAPGPFAWVRSLFGRSSGDETSAARESILGYVGLQMGNSMGHIVDIAVRKEYRRRGIGELLLRSAIEQALRINTTFISLEVRVSNKTAQALYEKYGFKTVEMRPGYYLDRNGRKEDGYYMATERIASVSYQALLQQLKQVASSAGARHVIG